METTILNQKFFIAPDGSIHCIDIMELNKDTWEEEIGDGFTEISKDEADRVTNPPLTHEQHVAIAESQKQALIAEASEKTELWRTQLMLGIITDEDKSSLKEWMLYVQKVQKADTSTAPDIDLPMKP
ncbi:tail fiber assembly protein [Morganella morganii]|nr:tail fiber assembly protein [Morganella morganii]